LFPIKYLLQHATRHVACVTNFGGYIAHEQPRSVVARDDAAQRGRIREAILQYVHRYPLAADTAEGILACWLPHTGFEDAPDHIAAVLEEMVANGWLQARQLPDGNILFHMPMRCEATAGLGNTRGSRPGRGKR